MALPIPESRDTHRQQLARQARQEFGIKDELEVFETLRSSPMTERDMAYALLNSAVLYAIFELGRQHGWEEGRRSMGY